MTIFHNHRSRLQSELSSISIHVHSSPTVLHLSIKGQSQFLIKKRLFFNDFFEKYPYFFSASNQTNFSLLWNDGRLQTHRMPTPQECKIDFPTYLEFYVLFSLAEKHYSFPSIQSNKLLQTEMKLSSSEPRNNKIQIYPRGPIIHNVSHCELARQNALVLLAKIPPNLHNLIRNWKIPPLFQQ